MFSDIKLSELPRQPYYQDPIKQFGRSASCVTVESPPWPLELFSPLVEPVVLAT